MQRSVIYSVSTRAGRVQESDQLPPPTSHGEKHQGREARSSVALHAWQRAFGFQSTSGCFKSAIIRHHQDQYVTGSSSIKAGRHATQFSSFGHSCRATLRQQRQSSIHPKESAADMLPLDVVTQTTTSQWLTFGHVSSQQCAAMICHDRCFALIIILASGMGQPC